MNFIEAIKLLKLDNTIKLKRRSKEVTFTLHPLENHFIKDDGYSLYLITVDDIFAEDWYVVKDEKLCSFEEAIVAFKNGKTIKRKATQTHYNTDRWPPEMALLSTQDLIANDWIIIDDEETK